MTRASNFSKTTTVNGIAGTDADVLATIPLGGVVSALSVDINATAVTTPDNTVCIVPQFQFAPGGAWMDVYDDIEGNTLRSGYEAAMFPVAAIGEYSNVPRQGWLINCLGLNAVRFRVIGNGTNSVTATITALSITER